MITWERLGRQLRVFDHEIDNVRKQVLAAGRYLYELIILVISQSPGADGNVGVTSVLAPRNI